MNIRITPSALRGRVEAIPSKSDAHRILIAAALADQPTVVRLGSSSRDIQATMECVRSLGAKIDHDAPGFLNISPVWGNTGDFASLDCGESGATLRFLLPVAAALGVPATFSGQGRLPQRPLQPLVEQLENHGCHFDRAGLPLTVRGRLTGGRYTLPGDVSSQFITGLLLALPLLEKDSRIVLASQLESKGYVQMTIATLKKFSIAIEEHAHGYQIKGGQKYRSPQHLSVEGDWSNAAFWICAGCLQGNEILCGGLAQDSWQGDKEIINLLRGFDANVSFFKDTAYATGKPLKALRIDAAEIPDLIPVMAVVATAAAGTTVIYNAKRLRIKESDRLAAIAQSLSQVGADVTEREDALLIRGGKPLRGGVVQGFGDHRIVMSMAIAAALCESELIIEGAEAVDKSYPQFFDHFKRLGGIADVI
ncbi:3-phosphoshikimate 1-carboxyvinyltransferase [Pelotomaculum schinkii]|uniref:3-phosphoshikimate 1-carboxyvinyltransferase n=1 Tax=Pelotomaculum schinkii TaxID=78350 RepID=A0A4Y7R6T5_9FIRM|nr:MULTISPECIES: 3-phosphoshikimate 1-carboxyvinyltransferase [Pelotomaculum]TEB04655.1 3-phosphoshikimate 1-carboxyvinyltransferase [Pelotomaculum schinkii]TEB16132.1 3-phosphoshikimate 1-carboxyvinyltransferase [Pelotomaculum sp. FP]